VQLTTRRKNIISGLVALVLLTAATTVGVRWSFGEYDDVYPLKASFTSAGEGLQKGSDIKIRGVNIGTVSSITLVDGQALVVMNINAGNQIPVSATATVRAKTLFGEKFIDITPGDKEASTNPDDFYSTHGEQLDRCDKSKQPNNSCTTGGFELEQVLADAYPVLKKIDPAELMTVVHTLAEAGRGLGPNINRSIVNGEKVFDVNAAHDADTRQFLSDLAKVSDQLGVRADDLMQAANDLNIALPTLNSRPDELNSLLVQTARLSDDMADVLRNNQGFIDKAFGGGQQVLNVLFDHRNDIVPLIVGLREYVQTLTEITRIGVGDGSLMGAVKSITCPDPTLFNCGGQSAAATANGPLGPGVPGVTVPGVPAVGGTAQDSGVAQFLQQLAQMGAS
jgi:phospholipid/cholesterol/gamma-HCH transport system substrate-binding protein